MQPKPALKIAFLVERFGYYKFYMPVIREALARGWAVSCWHDYGCPSSGPKDYLFPALEKAPEELQGCCEFNVYVDAADILKLESLATPDFIFSLRPPLTIFGSQERRTKATFVTLQSGIDNFLYEQHGDAGSDMNAVFSPYWLDLARGYFQALGPEQAERFERTFVARTWFSGYPGLDALQSVNREEVRARWNVPAGKRILLIFPMPLFGSTDAWQRFYRCRSWAAQMFEMLRRRDFGFWRYMAGGVNERAFAAAVRKFSVRNDLFVLVKGRQKSPIDPYLEAVADKIVYDEVEWLPTVFETIAVADACVHFQSYAALEVGAAGCPSICIRHPDSQNGSRADMPFFFSSSVGHVFNYPGVSKWMEIDDAVSTLPQLSLSDLTIDDRALEAFKKTFLSASDGKRLLDEVERWAAVAKGQVLENSETVSYG